MMNKKVLVLGILSLIVALALYLLDLGANQGIVYGVQVNIYATWFFVLLGGLLIFRSFFSYRSV
jgi:hypothetical protein